MAGPLKLQRAAVAIGAGAPALRLVLAAGLDAGSDGPAAACTDDGRLVLLPLTAAPSAAGAPALFNLALHRDAQPAQRLDQPWAAVCPLPRDGGLLLAQAGSCRLLFCPSVAALEPGQSADVFLLGSHNAPITTIATSRCGSQALSGDAAGGVKLWSLADGVELAAATAADSCGPAGSAGCPLAACCFLPDGTMLTAQQSCHVAQLWSFADDGCVGRALCLSGILDVGCSRQPVVLAACGQLLAVGCSDGSTQLWRCSGGEFTQHALLPALPAGDGSTPAAAVGWLAVSPVMGLLAVAAGPAVSICCAATGQLLAQQQLAGAPLALHWSTADSGNSSSPELLGLMADGSLQRLGAPTGMLSESCEEQTSPPAIQLAAVGGAGPWRLLAQHGAAVGPEPEAGLPASTGAASQQQQQPAPKPRKCVRFAAEVSCPAEQAAATARPAAPQCTSMTAEALPGQDEQALPSVGAPAAAWKLSAGGAVAARPARPRQLPPPLPLHPLLRSGLAPGGKCSSGSGRTSPPAIGTERSGAHTTSSWVGSEAAAGGRAAAAWPASRAAPLYPILDLRALQGLAATQQPVASAVMAGAAVLSAPPQSPPFKRAPATVRTAPGGISTTRSVQHAGTSTDSAGLGDSWQPASKVMLGSPAEPQAQPQPAEGAAAAAAAAEEEEAPRKLELPAPVQPTFHTSKQRCDACVVLGKADEAAAGAVTGSTASCSSRPGSPAKAALLAEVAALGQQPKAVCSGNSCSHAGMPDGSSRPSSPLKLGVVCTSAGQGQQGSTVEEKTVIAVEHDVTLAHSEFRQQRHIRLSRLHKPQPAAVAAGQALSTPQQQPGRAAATAAQPPPLQQQPEQCGRHVFTAGCFAPNSSDAAAATTRHSEAEGSLDLREAAASCDAPAAAREAAGAPEAVAEALKPQTTMPSMGDRFAVGSDTELSDGEEELPATYPPGAGSCTNGGSTIPMQAGGDSLPAVQASCSDDTLSDAAEVQPRLWQPAASLQQRREQLRAGHESGAVRPSGCQGSRAAAAGGLCCQATQNADHRVAGGVLGPAAGLAGNQVAGRLGSLAPGVQRYIPALQHGCAVPAEHHWPATAAAPASARPSPALAEPHGPASCAVPASSQAAAAAATAPFLPASALAVPAPNSSRIAAAQADRLQQQAAHAASAPLSEEQLAEVRRRAATAATTVAPGARIYATRPPPPAAAAGNSAGAQLSEGKAAALAGARKQLDKRWLAEQRELRPALEPLWSAAQRVPQRAGLLLLPHLAVPLPSGAQLAAEFLGLKQ